MKDQEKNREELVKEIQELREEINSMKSVFLKEITESRKTESSFKAVLEKNPMSIQILDMNGFTIRTNSAHTKLFGVAPPVDYSIFKDHQLLNQGFGELFERIKSGEIVYFPDSQFNVHDVDPSFPDVSAWIRAIGFTINDNNGVPERIVLMHENISERKHVEALLQDIINKNPLSIQIVDTNGFTLQGNPAYISLFGAYPPPNFSIFEDLQKRGSGEFIQRAKNGEVVHMPDQYYNAHDVVPEAPDIPLWIRAVLFPLLGSDGKPERFVFMHENITARKKAEDELIKAKERAEESDQLKSAFLANMSHEIRTPMNGILGFAELLKEPELTGEQQQEYIRIIEKSGVRLLKLINDIIDISKIEAGLMRVEMKESNINEQIEYIYTFFKHEVEASGIKLLFKNTLTGKEATIVTDREKLYAILTNLVKNSIKYTISGSIEFGYDLIETTQMVDHKSNNLSSQNARYLQFYVKDTGIGIPKNRQEAIFERFIQADISDKMARQGAGLGLSITKAYLKMLGGEIWVESEEGIGSTFYFTIPYNVDLQKKIHFENDSLTNESFNKMYPENTALKVLLAEDDETSEMLLSIELLKFSREIIKARTGKEAVEICQKNNDIDLILMDIQMPDLNGYEATRQIRKFNKDVIIIAQTAYALSGDTEKTIEAGCDDYISKPIVKDELIEIINKYFRR
jgi:signal transduction histidine kinase/CheY-like chemotaxis protein